MKSAKKLNVPREQQEEQSNPSHDHAATRLVKTCYNHAPVYEGLCLFDNKESANFKWLVTFGFLS